MLLKIIITVVVIFLIINFLWRMSSNRYKLPCPSWLGWLVELDNPFAKAHQAKEIVKNLGLAQGMTVLDVGCGPGRVTIPLAVELGPTGKVVALDMQQAMLNKVKEKAEALSLKNIDLFHAEIGEGKFDHNTFDRVILVAALGEIPDQESALKEIFAALKPAGILSITETLFDPHYQRRNKVLQLAKSIGFQEKVRFGNFLAYTMNLEKPREMDKVNIEESFKTINEYWTPKIVAELNDSYVKLAKLKGEFIWHQHDNEDELFLVVKGELLMKFKEKDVILKPGEFMVVPKGTQHLPIANSETHIILIEPKTTLKTGDADIM